VVLHSVLKPPPVFLRIALLSSLFVSLLGVAKAADVERPKFRGGLWRFERTVEYVRRPPNENLVLSKTDATRCVDPNIAMASIFASPPIRGCRSEAPQRFDNQYVFGTRCDVMGPVSTVITADSENAYSEVNLLVADPLPKRDTVLARRVGDCSVAASVDGVSSARARRR
jgi:hypothetical protein